MSILDGLPVVLVSVLDVVVAQVGRMLPLDVAGTVGLSFMVSLLGVVSLDVDMCICVLGSS